MKYLLAVLLCLWPREGVLHVMASRVIDRSEVLARLSDPDLSAGDARDFAQNPDMARHPRNVRLLPKSRDFH